MTEGISVNAVAAAWVDALTSRGVTLQVRGKSLAYRPKSAYGEMSNQERATLKLHKAAIVALINECYAGTAGPSVQATAPTTAEGLAPTTAPAPEPCAWCRRAPCIGASHDSFLALHPHEAQKHADKLATQEMMQQVGKGLPHWYQR